MQAPSLVLNNSGSRQQVPLRDYLNTRLAPFLKKAITESLDKEAEFPLQWLGECLINQSILYEGNPDPTNIKERFRYTFDAPAAQVTRQAEMETETETEAETATNGLPPAATTAEPPLETILNGEKTLEGEEETITEPAAEEAQAQSQAPPPVDTEMGGTA